MVVLAGDNRSGHAGSMAADAVTDAEAVKLFRTMAALDGTYKIEGKGKYLAHVTDSWIQSWNGTDQHREYKITGKQMVLSFKAKDATGGDVAIAITFTRVE